MALNAFTIQDYRSLGIIGLGLAFSNAGGSGGGSITIPLLVLFLNIPLQNAIPLGNVAVLGSACSSLLFNLYKIHPIIKSRWLVDWDVISMMEPTAMIGVLIGAYLHKAMPEWLSVLLLLIILSFTSTRMLYKGFADLFRESYRSGYDQIQDLATQYDQRVPGEGLVPMHNSISRLDLVLLSDLNLNMTPKSSFSVNTKGLKNSRSETILTAITASLGTTNDITAFRSSTSPLKYNNYGSTPRKIGAINISHVNPKMSPFQLDNDRNESLNESDFVITVPLNNSGMTSDSLQLPYKTFFLLFLLFAGSFFINFVKTTVLAKDINSADDLLVVCVSFAFYMAIVSYIALIGYFLRLPVLRLWEDRFCSNYQPIEGEVIWDSRNSFVYPILCTFAGIIAAAFGSGGGIIKAPLMIGKYILLCGYHVFNHVNCIEMGIHPYVASTTSTVMIFFTSISATSSYILDGSLKSSQCNYALVLFSLGVLSNILSQKVLLTIIQRYQQTSFLTILLGLMVAISAALMTVETMMRK